MQVERTVWDPEYSLPLVYTCRALWVWVATRVERTTAVGLCFGGIVIAGGARKT